MVAESGTVFVCEQLDRYAVYAQLGMGGMARVDLGRQRGAAGFARTVVVKRLHAQFAADPDFVAMFVDEARLASRVRHPNVVPTLDVVSSNGVILLVMEYVHGESLGNLLKAGRPPVNVGLAIVEGLLEGLHAAHEARSERGDPLEIVHRDVSPHNVIVGEDGIARVLDFGIAKAAHRLHTTGDLGTLKGKCAYMSPEQLLSEPLDRRADVFSAGVVLWEVLTGRQLFEASTPAARIARSLSGDARPPSEVCADVPRALDELVLRAVSRETSARFRTAKDMALALEAAAAPARRREVADWVRAMAGESLDERARLIARLEQLDSKLDPASPQTSTPPIGVPLTPSATTAPAGSLKPLPRGVWVAVAASGALLSIALGVFAAGRRGTHAELPMEQQPAAAASLPVPIAQSSPAPSEEQAQAPSAAPARVPAPQPRSAPPRCHPPYTIRPDGIHVPKPECLHTP